MQLAPLPVVIPLIAAAVLAAAGKRARPSWAFAISIAAALSAGVIGAALLARTSGVPDVYWFGGWTPRNGVAIGICFVIDRISAGLVILISILMTAALLFSSRYFDSVGNLYYVLMLGFLATMCGFSMTGDLFNLFVFFELMSAAAFALCGYKTEEPAPLQGALNFAVTNTIGAFLTLAGIALLYGRTGALNMAQIGESLKSPADGLVIVSFLLVTGGFLIKAAVVPYHFWLADAHAVAPTPVCVLFSGVMVQLGLYGVIRVFWTIYEKPLSIHAAGLGRVLIAAGVVTAIYGAVMCWNQRHIKRLLAFSTISHTGLLIVGFGLLQPGGLAGTAIYVLGHAFVKASLFLCSGIMLHRFGSIDELELRGRGKGHLLIGAVTLAGGLGLADMPPFGTFWGASLIFEAASSSGYGWLEWVFGAASMLTAGAVLRLFGRVFAGWGPRYPVSSNSAQIEEEPETVAGHSHVPAVMMIPALVLIVLGVAVGAVSGWQQTLFSAAIRMQDRAGYAGHVLYGAIHQTQIAQAWNPWKTETLLHGFGTVCGAILLAGLSLFHRRIRLKRRLSGNWMGIHFLQRLQSGHIGDYVTWILVGLFAFGAAFASVLR